VSVDLHSVFEGTEATLGHLAGVSVPVLGAALALHLLKLAARTRAWQNILLASYPETRLRFRDALGAFLAGVGVDAVVPARTGQLLRLGLARRRLPGASMPGLASTLVVESLFDAVLAALVLGAAIAFGLRTGVPSPAAALGPIVRHPVVVGVVASALAAATTALVVRFRAFPRSLLGELRRGLAALADPILYARRVASWQALGWSLRVASVYLFLAAFHVPATVGTALIVVVVQVVASAFPLTPGGAGTQQALLAGALSASAAAGVVGFGVGMQAATAAVEVVSGAAALGLATGSLRWRPLTQGSDREEAACAPVQA
jgi:uncharacterized membrane protein YbhN (UPF0104 family)